jgi:uncharacterized RDD family membrane protein YckC
MNRGARFCVSCGAPVEPEAVTALISLPRASLIRRALAEVIDRLLPLPFISYFIPVWVFVVVAYHLICDGTPSGQSVGKWLCRVRVVSVASKEPCGITRAALRRLPTAIGQAAYCLWFMVPFVFAYELLSLAFVWLNPTGRRIEDYISGTQVITESAYRKLHPACIKCGERIKVGARFCPHCGVSTIQQVKVNGGAYDD